jgi:hypothetical protein
VKGERHFFSLFAQNEEKRKTKKEEQEKKGRKLCSLSFSRCLFCFLESDAHSSSKPRSSL